MIPSKIRLILISSGILALATFISRCTSNVTDALIKATEQKCVDKKHSPCVISLNEVTKFQWDKLYLFPSWTNSDTISSRIGFAYMGDDVPDDYRRMLFVYQNKIVHEEDFKSFEYNSSTIYIDIEKAFDSLSTEKSHFFTPALALFTVKKTRDTQGCNSCYIYSLVPAKK